MVLSVRVPISVAQALHAAAGGQEHWTEWVTRLLQQALRGGQLPGPGTAQAEGFAEGKRQGWAFANKVFREALAEAAARLKS